MQSTVKGFSGPGGTAAVQDGTRPFAAVALVMLSIVSVSYSLAQSLVNPALQQLRVDFHASLAGISWILTAYLLSSAVLTPFLGRVGDHRGKERLLVATTGLLSAGSAGVPSEHGWVVAFLALALAAAAGAATCLLIPERRGEHGEDR